MTLIQRKASDMTKAKEKYGGYTRTTARKHQKIWNDLANDIFRWQVRVSVHISAARSGKQEWAWWWMANLNAMSGILDTASYAVTWWVENHKRNNNL